MKILKETPDYIIVTDDDLEDEFEEWYYAECYLKQNNDFICTACGGGGPKYYKELKGGKEK